MPAELDYSSVVSYVPKVQEAVNCSPGGEVRLDTAIMMCHSQYFPQSEYDM